MPGPIPLTSFAPDADPLSQGVIVDGNDFIPSMVGFRTLPDILTVSQPLPAFCRGATVMTFGDGEQWIVAGCADDDGSNLSLCTLKSSDLDPNIPPAWNVEMLGLPAVPGVRWRFDIWQNAKVYDQNNPSAAPRDATQLDQEIIAVDGCHQPLSATRLRLDTNPSTAWQTLWGIPAAPGQPTSGAPPISSHVCATDFFLFLVGDLNLSSLPVITNRWWATPNSNVWNLDTAYESVSARLAQTVGPITGMLAQRSSVIAYKANATYSGQLTNATAGSVPLIWAFNEISRQVGAQGQEAILPIRDVHNFVGPDDFFTLDGFSITPIPNALRRWFIERCCRENRSKAQTRFDQSRSVAFIHYTTDDNPDQRMLNEWIVLNIVTGQWGHGTKNVQAAIQGPIHIGGECTGAIIQEDGTLGIFAKDGVRTTPAFLITGDQGDRRQMFTTQPCRPAFTILNGVPTLTPLNAYYSGGPYTPGHTVTFQPNGWFNILNTARLQRFRLDVSADCEIGSLDMPLVPEGDA